MIWIQPGQILIEFGNGNEQCVYTCAVCGGAGDAGGYGGLWFGTHVGELVLEQPTPTLSGHTK